MSVKNYSDKQLLLELNNVLHENMEKGKVGIKTLAAKLAISTCQLNRRVKEITGQTTSEYILDVRLNEAKRLLAKFPEISIFEIARQCGFADTAHFSHVFRRNEGLSPTQYILELHQSQIPLKE